MRRLKLALFTAAFRLALVGLMVICWLDDRLRFRLPFPRNADELRDRPAWCVAQLQRAGQLPEAGALERFEVTPFRGEAAFRSTLAAVHLTFAGDRGRVELELVAKFAPTAGSLRDRAVYVIQENHVKEVSFYQHLADDCGEAAPRAYFAEMSRATGHFCLLLERVVGLEISERAGCPIPRAEQLIRAFARLHAHHWGMRRPSARWIAPVPEVVIDFFASLFEGEGSEVFSEVLGLCWRQHQEPPQTVIHADARVGNVIFPASETDGRVVIIDWQCVRQGRGIYEVAYLLAVSLTEADRRAHESRLVELYHRALVQAGVEGYDLETCRDDYRYAILMVLALLDLPFLVAEANVDDANADAFEEVRATWFERLACVIEDFDYAWLAERCRFDADHLRRACLDSVARKRLAHAERRAEAERRALSS